MWLQSLEEASRLLRGFVREGDTVLVEGSARLNMALIIEDLVEQFGREQGENAAVSK